MKSLEEIGLQLNKLRIGKLEDIAYDSIDPINEITDIFKKDCKIFDSGISDGINFNRMVMDKNFLGRPLEVVTVTYKSGDLIQVGIHGNTSKVVKEFNKLSQLLLDLDKTPEGYTGFLGERKGIKYYGNMLADFVFGIAVDVQSHGDTLQIFTRNPFKK